MPMPQNPITPINPSPGSTDSNTSIEATAKKLVTWMTGLIHDEHIRIDETEIQAATDLVKEPLVNDLIKYFDDPITNPRTHSHSPTDYFDVLTGTKVKGISSPSDTNVSDLAKQLKTELTSDEVTKLENYFGSKSEADVIVDGLRVLKNLNTVSTIENAGLQAQFKAGKYTDNKGLMVWYSGSGDGQWSKSVLRNETDVSAFLSTLASQPQNIEIHNPAIFAPTLHWQR
jgi:hypothetical protein